MDTVPRVNVVLTCTKRKRHAAPSALQLRSYAADAPGQRLARWLAALAASAVEEPRVPLCDLYAGDHWQKGCELPAAATARGMDARLWVCSAGYGLVPADAPVRPYSATFSRGNPDAVWRSGDGGTHAQGVEAWWRGVSEWEGPQPGAPRTVEALARTDPGAAVWVVASSTYLNAMRADLAAAAGALDEEDRLVLVSAGCRGLPGLERNFLHFDWRLQGSGGPLAGAAMSLNVRVALLLLQGGSETSADALNERLRSILGSIPARTPVTRRRVSEAEVEGYLRAELAARPDARKTPLLRKLRSEMGWAFEEKRFGRLFDRLHAVHS
ncbi:MAG TPA: hypothetical protein VF647_13780 [Longimicrobium sp.]|jgi:hypothetical protein